MGHIHISGEGDEGSDGWHDYVDLKNVVKALGDVVRLNILHALAGDVEITVTDLALRLLVSQPLISWHLTMLRRAGLVRTRRKGRLVYCSLNAERYAEALTRLGEVIAMPVNARVDATDAASQQPESI